ncbi:MAG: antibiotic biosynthesis monooxygenase [Clostridiales Family XIII bacterium]|jgi:quinol monooxygenase YgiN|nr:antibiotic biosynthesis monooxygenase [Clostridiales Family XIII bacterium]
MIIAYFKMKLNRGERQDFIDEMKAAGAFEQARAEKGNISYEYYFSTDDANTVVGVERWESLEDFRNHLSNGYVKELGDIQANYDVDFEPNLYSAEPVPE